MEYFKIIKSNEDGLAVYERASIAACQSVYGQSNVRSNMTLELGQASLSWIFLDHESGAARQALSICLEPTRTT